MRKHNTPTRCRRELESSFNAVEHAERPREAIQSKKSKVSYHFTYPRCSTCPDTSPGRLRKFAVSVCDVCKVYLCTTCTRKHRMDWNGHVVTLISPKPDVDEHFRTKNGCHRPVCYEGHKDIPKYFCETCQDVICLECIETRHKKHEFVYAKDAYAKHKVALEKHIENARLEADRIVKKLGQGMFDLTFFSSITSKIMISRYPLIWPRGIAPENAHLVTSCLCTVFLKLSKN